MTGSAGSDAAFRALVATINGDTGLALEQFQGLTRLEVIGALGFLVGGYADLIAHLARLNGVNIDDVLPRAALRLATDNERPTE